MTKKNHRTTKKQDHKASQSDACITPERKLEILTALQKAMKKLNS